MKKILSSVILSGAILVGCGTETTDVTSGYSMPDGLEGCKVFEMNSSWYHDIYVVRCPTVTITNEEHSCGKGCITKNNITTSNF